MEILINDQLFVPQRIFCIGKNYFAHVKELGEETAISEPVVFMKPISSLVLPNETLYVPDYVSEIHHEVEAVLLIGKEGINISEKDAPSFIAGITVGLDLTLRDIQSKLKKSGHPWELSKAFEQSAPLGLFQTYGPGNLDLENWSFSCSVNGQPKQNGNTRNMIFPISTLIYKLSRWWKLKPGDIIYTGTPSGVGPLVPGDQVEIQSPSIGSFAWPLGKIKYG